jgi:hypothetical protein
MDEATRNALRMLGLKLDELADKQQSTADKSGDGDYARGARDAYRDAARRVRGLTNL